MNIEHGTKLHKKIVPLCKNRSISPSKFQTKYLDYSRTKQYLRNSFGRNNLNIND